MSENFQVLGFCGQLHEGQGIVTEAWASCEAQLCGRAVRFKKLDFKPSNPKPNPKP